MGNVNVLRGGIEVSVDGSTFNENSSFSGENFSNGDNPVSLGDSSQRSSGGVALLEVLFDATNVQLRDLIVQVE